MAGTGLANFREQYPQYSDLEDEELAGLVKQKWYADMDDAVYRDRMGLPAPAEPEPEPSIWDKITDAMGEDANTPANILNPDHHISHDFSAEPANETPQTSEQKSTSPLLRDQFFAGFDEWRSNRATATALDAIDTHNRADDLVLGTEEADLTPIQRQLRGSIDEDIARVKARQVEILQGAIDKRSELMARAKTVPYSQATQEMLEADGLGEGIGELADDPMQIIAEISLRSLPNMADAIPLMAAGAIAGGPFGFAAGAGAGTAMTEYRSSIADSLQQQGVDLSSAESLIEATQNPQVMASAHDYATKRATIIGAAGAFSGGLAAKPLTPFVKNALGREISNVVAQTGAQATIEGSGEALAQLATEGQIRGGEVLAEAVGGAATAPIDVGGAAVTGLRAQAAKAEAVRVEAELKEMMGGPDKVPRETIEPELETSGTESAAPMAMREPEKNYSRPVREQLITEAQELGTDVPARRAQKAVERAISGRPLTPGESNIVETMLDDDVLAMKTPDTERRGIDRRQSDAVYEGSERRVADRRAKIRQMSTDQLVDAVYTDPLTGIANARAFEEDLPGHAWVAEIDADSLKFINDNLSENAGDAMLIAVAEAIEQSDVDAYRVGGDEFWLGGTTKEEVESAAEFAKSILSAQTVTDPRGKVEGVSITYGVGQSREIASARMKQHKGRREREGKRAARGTAPKNTTLKRQAETINMEPGTNYVSMIGQTGSLPIDANHNLVLGNGRAVRIPKTPVRREHILAIMQKAFGVKIYQGTHFKTRGALGFYRPGQGEIRNKKYNDIETAAHEVAHYLDDRFPWIKKLYSQYEEEVRSVSYDASKVYEGWAEFMRLFMTQEYEAIHRAPSFYDAFRKELKNHPKIEETIYDVQELMHAWTQQGARARLASKHGATDASAYERIARLFRVPLLQSALDGLRRVKEIGMEVPGVDDAYRKLRLALGGSNGVLEAAMYYGTPGWRDDRQGLEFSGESLQDIFGQRWGDEDMALYMMARRGQELAEQGRENLMRPDEIAAGLRIGDENPEFAGMFARFQEFNQRMLDFTEGAGILGTETRAAFEEMNKSYVPFHRVVESEIDNRSVRTGGNPFQRLKGGTQNVANLWDNMVNNTGMMIRASLINDGKRSLLSALSKGSKLGSGEMNQAAGKYAAPISTRDAPVSVPSDQLIRKVVEAMGVDWEAYRMAREGMLSGDPDEARLEQGVVEAVSRMQVGLGEFVQLWQVGLDPIGQVDYYLDGGKKKWFEIGDAGLYDSLQHLGPKGTNLVLQIFGGFSAALRRGVVSLPVFQVKNFIRDTTNAWLLSDHVKVPAARAMRIALSNIEKDPSYREMFLNGGGFASRSQGLEAQRKIIIDPTRLAATYDRFMGRFENANRLAEYKASREAGESPRQSAMLSREISTDFAMRGSSEVARFLAVSVPFLNARLQGNYRIARQFDTADHALSYAMRGSALMLATLGLYALNKDDERYEELPEDIKDLNWIVFTGNGEDDYFLIPKPFESGMLFGTIPERMFELTEERDGKEFADAMGWMFLQTFSMDMTPQAFQPEIDIQKNKNFTGAPIIPFYLDNVEPSQQYTYYTSEAARAAGKHFGVSPIKLEHRIRGYLGTMGTYALGASDAVIRATTDPDELAFGESPSRGDSWKENIIVRGLIDPLVGEGPPRRTKYVTDLYNMIREASKVANTTDLMLRRQNAEVEQYIADPQNQPQIIANPTLEAARKSMGTIRRQMDMIRMAKDMSADEKRGKLWELTRTRNKLARDVVTAIREQGQ